MSTHTDRRTHDLDLDGPDARHRHDRRCYWDLRICAWRCPAADTRAPGGPAPDRPAPA